MAALKRFELKAWMLDGPVLYIRKTPDGLYVGETVSLRDRYNEGERRTIIHVRKACQNTVARRRQEQALIAGLVEAGITVANEKVQTHDLTPVLTSCHAPNPAPKRKRWIPDPDPDPVPGCAEDDLDCDPD